MIKEYAFAKINLSLDVVKKREDWFHELKMIMIPIELKDILTFEEDKELTLISNVDIEDNAIIKTANIMKEKFNIESGAKITLEKNIPIGAGLAGGSADIAATIRGLNQLWELNLSKTQLEDLAISLGSDTLFCLYNQSAYVFGRGDQMLFIRQMPIEKIYLFTSTINVSTKKVFSHHIIEHRTHQFDKLLQKYINEKDQWVINHAYNHLTKTTLNTYPKMKEIYDKLKKSRLNFLMSGSGSSFFITSFKSNDKKISRKIEKIGLQYIETRPKT